MERVSKNYYYIIRGVKGYLLSQFVIDEKNNIQFHWQQISGLDARNEMEKLKNHICLMGEKYVLVRMPPDDKNIYVAYFKNKIHIGFSDMLSDDKVGEIKNLFIGNIIKGKQSALCGQLSATIEIRHDFKKVCIVAVKSALNTLAYLKGAEYITQTKDFKGIIEWVISESDEILNCVNGINFDRVVALRQRLYLDNDQLACILTVEGYKLKALFFVYEHGFEISLCHDCTVPCDILLDGIVCDWKNRKDYQYLELLKKKGVLC